MFRGLATTLRVRVESRMLPPFPHANGMNFLNSTSRSPEFIPKPFTPPPSASMRATACANSAQVAGGFAESSPARFRRSVFTNIARVPSIQGMA